MILPDPSHGDSPGFGVLGITFGILLEPPGSTVFLGGFLLNLLPRSRPRHSPDFEAPMLLTALVLAGVKEDSLKLVINFLVMI